MRVPSDQDLGCRVLGLGCRFQAIIAAHKQPKLLFCLVGTEHLGQYGLTVDAGNTKFVLA